MKRKLKSIITAALCAVGLAAAAGLEPVEYLDWDEVGKEMTNAVCTTYTVVAADTATFEAGKTYVVMDDVTVSSRITVKGTVAEPTRLILCDGTKLTASAGVKVTVSNATTHALVICGQTLGTGALEATGGQRAAGIGALSSDTQPAGSESGIGGMVTINGGTVTATGGQCGAGIGGGWGGAGGTVTINGGTVTATGGDCGAGIGGGYDGAGGTVTINGGTVTATAGTEGEVPTVAIGCCQESGDNGTVKFGAGKWLILAGNAAPGDDMTAEAYAADHSAKYAHIESAAPEISAESAEGFLDLTVGDRIAAAEEPLVVDPAWGNAENAEIQIDGEGNARAYTSASNDTWQTTTLTPGRYAMSLTAGAIAGEDAYTAAFWKLGADWVVFDGSNVTADMTFEAGTTYLFFGTNTADGAELKVEDGAKFFYGEGVPSGFKGGTVTMSKRYKQVDGDLYQIVEVIKGCEDNPWDVGEGVTAYTNGNELVIGGAGTVGALSGVDGLKDLLADLTAINVTSNGVTGAEEQAFLGLGTEDSLVALTLPDGWQGELPDNEDGNWYGAKVNSTRIPLAVKNVTFLQRYPWNGKVDVGFTLTGPAGETNVIVTVRDGETEVTNFTAAVTIPTDGVLETSLVWDAATAGLGVDFKSDDVTVEVAFAGGAADPTAPVQLWADGPYFATCNVGANTPQEYGYYFWWGDTVGYTNNGSAWVSVVDGTSIQFNGNDPTATNTYKKSATELKSLGYIDDESNPVLNAAHDAAKVKLGDSWRMMTKVELDALTNTACCTSVWTDNWNNTGVKGYVVTGNTSGYTDKSIFLPAAGYGNNSTTNNAGMYGGYRSSTPDLVNSDNASCLAFAENVFRASSLPRYYGYIVRAVRVTPPEDTPAPVISAKSEAGTVDLRDDVPLDEGETTVSIVTWSATAWGEVPGATSTDLGYTNLTTGATGTRGTGLAGADAGAVTLPQKDGDYVLTHSTGEFKSFVTFTVSGYPLGIEGNPWLVGAGDDPASVTAVSNGEGAVFFTPARGAVTKEGLTAIADAMGGADFPAKLVSEDGTATNEVVMVLGDSGTVYGNLADALAADEASYTLFDVNGYFVSYSGGEGALGTMATDTFIPTVPTNLTANAYEIIGYGFAGWTKDGTTVAYTNRHEGVDFAAPGETLELTALWEPVETKAANYVELTNMAAKATRPVTITLDGDVEFPADGKIEIPELRDVTFAGEGKFVATNTIPALFDGITVGTGLKEDDLGRFVTDKDVKAYYEDGKVVLRSRGETEEFPWVLDEESGVAAWVDEALTNLAGVVIDNGLPMATNAIDLVALTNNLATYGYEPAKTPLNALLKVEDGGAPEYVRPVNWMDEDGNEYKTLADAIDEGVTAVVPNFETKETEIPQEIVETAEVDGETYTAVVENKPVEDVEEPVKAVYAEGLIDLATNESKNVTLVVTPSNGTVVATVVVESLAASNTNGVSDVVGYDASYVDLSLYFNDVPQSEIGEVLAIHVPWTMNSRQVYRVSRVHNGVTEPLPIGEENAVDGEYIEVLADGFIIHAKKYSLYAIGEITLQQRFGIVVGNGEKTMGEPDPSYIATNFTVNVQGLDIEPGDIRGYCVRAKGEAEGEYAINFVCTKMPQDFDGELVVTPGVFTITPSEGPFVASGTVTYPKAAKNSEYLKPNANATWKAKPDACSAFVKWVAAEGASETVTNLLAQAGEVKCAKTTLTLKIPAGAQVKPTDVVAVWKLIDADVPAGQAAVMLWCDPAMGTVKGTGVVALGKDGTKKVSINAIANDSYVNKHGVRIFRSFVFAGWYLDPGFSQPATFASGKDYREAPQSITVTTNTYLFARFVEKSSNADPITWLRYAGAGYCGAAKDWLAEEETWYQGVALPTNGCQVAFGSLSLPTVTVSGLPAGVKFDKTALRFTGVPTACSTEKKPFFTVKISVKNKSGATDILFKNVRVEPLPAWAVGNFDGYHVEEGATNGTFTATVGKTGKVSGKTAGGLAATTFSAKNFSKVFTLDGENLIYAVDVEVKVKGQKETATDTLYLMEDLNTGLGTIGGGDAAGNGCVGVQRAWDRKADAAIGFSDFPAFDTKALKDPVTIEGTDLTLKFGAKGKVTVGGTVGGVKASGSTYVLPVAWRSTTEPSELLAQVPVCVAPKKGLGSGFCAVYDVLLTAGEDGNFVEAELQLPQSN